MQRYSEIVYVVAKTTTQKPHFFKFTAFLRIQKQEKPLDEISTLVRVFNNMSNNPACVQAPRQPHHSYRYPFQDSISSRQKHRFLQNLKNKVILFSEVTDIIR